MDTHNIPFDLQTLDEIPIIGEDSEDKEQPRLEETENHLDKYNIPCQINDENITIADERENPVSILMDKNRK